MKAVSIVVVCIVSIIAFEGCANEHSARAPLYYAEFMESGGLHVDTNYVYTDTDLARLKATFEYYSDGEFVVDSYGHTLMVPLAIAADTQYVANLISKSRDSVWYYEHIDPGSLNEVKYAQMVYIAQDSTGRYSVDSSYASDPAALWRVQATLVHLGVDVRLDTVRGVLIMPEILCSDSAYIAEILRLSRDSAWYYEHVDSSGRGSLPMPGR